MNSNNIVRKIAIVTFAAVAIGTGSFLSLGHSHAAEFVAEGGTQDINIGVGELQECTISKSTDSNQGGNLAPMAEPEREWPMLGSQQGASAPVRPKAEWKLEKGAK